MTTPTQAETTVPTEQPIVEFIHSLGGDVHVVGYDAEGAEVAVIYTPITDVEAEVHDPTGTAVRLVATLVEPKAS